MFTIITLFAISGLAFAAQWVSRREPTNAEILARHMRQDLRLIVFILAGILVMLGVIADKLPH
jgi:hypothetical protein